MRTATSNLLLCRRGLLFLPPTRVASEGRAETTHDVERMAEPGEVEALMLELAALGYACTPRLRAGFERLSTTQLAELREQTIAALAAHIGAAQRHEPLFRRFPRDVPRDTAALWFQRVLVHFIQTPEQPCLWCDAMGSTHVLRPCEHVVCDSCFDGSNYSACPICNRKVDRSSPFFTADELRRVPKERIVFKRLELGEDLDAAARALFEDFCARTQALNPTDKLAFTTLLDDYRTEVLAWLPEKLPLRENVALVFGRLFMHAPAEQVLASARVYLRTATDVLRLIAVVSGADAALQGATVYDYEELRYVDAPWWASWLATTSATPELVRRYIDMTYRVAKPRTVKRFPMAKLGRATRRALLSILDGLDEDALIEDMLRHRSYWVWVGEFLHPGEYAKRFPKVGQAFRIIRKRDPDGARAERFLGFYAKLERAAAAGDSEAMLELLRARPGELARRFDHLLRIAGADQQAAEKIVAAFVAHVGSFSTPVLLTLYGVLPTRATRAKRRMFWPKGGVSKGVTTSDRRPTLPASVIEAARQPIERELLRRFAALPHFQTAIVDEALRDIVAPFNERTASPSAVNLPRGSKIHVPPGKLVRLFLHWCERQGGESTDVDLSIAFYDAAWQYLGVCSYYNLKLVLGNETVATSSGDLTSAPFPDGASEFVDLDRAAARKHGIRYAVMVVNAYSGDPFDLLERAYAGVMLRDDRDGHHFDPRTVALKFALQGANGIYMPLCIDLESDTLHWLDVYSTGELAMNNVASSSAAITRICPETLDYFASNIRVDLRTVALLHAAARCERVIVRDGERANSYARRDGESPAEFYQRIQAAADGHEQAVIELGEQPVLALLHRGDLLGDRGVPAGSSIYALFREQLEPTMDASDLSAVLAAASATA